MTFFSSVATSAERRALSSLLPAVPGVLSPERFALSKLRKGVEELSAEDIEELV
jgi:hypothetical protein